MAEHLDTTTDQTITGTKTFDTDPILSDGNAAPTDTSNTADYWPRDAYAIDVTAPAYGAVGDGVTNDNAAITAAIAVGRDVYFPPTKSFGINAITPLSNTKWFGGGTLKCLAGGTTRIINASSTTSWTMEGITVDATATLGVAYVLETTSAVRLTLRDCLFAGTAATRTDVTHVVRGDNMTFPTVVGCEFRNFGAEAIRMANAAHGKWNGNRFENIQRNSTVTNRCILIGGGSHYQINDNTFKDVGNTAGAYAQDVVCIDVGNTDNGVVSGNVADNVYGFIDIESADANRPHHITVVGNEGLGFNNAATGSAWGGNGIWVNQATQSSQAVNISGNVMAGFLRGIHAQAGLGVNIVGNGCYNNGQEGIRSVNSRLVNITGNNCRDNGRQTTLTYNAIHVYQVVGFSGGVVANNIVSGADNLYGIYSESNPGDYTDGQRIIVQGNQCGTLKIAADKPRNLLDFGNSGGLVGDQAGAVAPVLLGRTKWSSSNTGATTITSFVCPPGETKQFFINDNLTTIDFSQVAIVDPTYNTTRLMNSGEMVLITLGAGGSNNKVHTQVLGL